MHLLDPSWLFLHVGAFVLVIVLKNLFVLCRLWLDLVSSDGYVVELLRFSL